MIIRYSSFVFGLLMLVALSTASALDGNSKSQPDPSENSRKNTNLRDMWKQSKAVSEKNHIEITAQPKISNRTIHEVSDELPVDTDELETDTTHPMLSAAQTNSSQQNTTTISTPPPPATSDSAQPTTNTTTSSTSTPSQPTTTQSTQVDSSVVIPYPVFILAEPRPSQASIESVNAAIDAAEANTTQTQPESKAQLILAAQKNIQSSEEDTTASTPNDQAVTEAVNQQEHTAKKTSTPISLTVEEADGKVEHFEITEDQIETAAGEISNSIIAIVENRPITLYEVFEQMAPVIPQVQKESRSQEEFTMKIKVLERQALDNIIDGVLIVKYFESKKFQIPDNILDNEINEFIQTRYNGDKGLFIKDLQRIGKSMRKFREEMKERIIIQAMQERMLKTKSHVSPEKIRTYYLANLNEFEQEPSVEISQITLKGSPEERTNLTKIIMDALNSGRKFSELANQYSQDQKAAAGGYWGWIPKSSLRPELATPIFQLEAHQFSKPIEVGDRTYIIYVNAKKTGGARPLEEVQGIIEEKVSRELSRESYNEWLQHLRSRAYVRYTQDSKDIR